MSRKRDSASVNIADQILSRLPWMSADYKARMRADVNDRVRHALLPEGLKPEQIQQLGDPNVDTAPLAEWCSRQLDAARFEETDFAPLFTAADLVDEMAAGPRSLLAFEPSAWRVDGSGRLCVFGPAVDLARVMSGSLRMSDDQRELTKEIGHPRLRRGLGEIEPKVASEFSFTAFLAVVFLEVPYCPSIGQWQDVLGRCHERGECPVPPGLTRWFQEVLLTSSKSGADLSCRQRVSMILERHRQNPFDCSPPIVTDCRHEQWGYSVPGKQKRGGQEDRLDWWTQGNSATLMVVADGVSTADLGTGAIAAEEILRHIHRVQLPLWRRAVEHCNNDPDRWPEVARDFLKHLVEGAHQQIVRVINHYHQDGAGHGRHGSRRDGPEELPIPQSPMCSTIVAAFVRGSQAVIAHVGDSPAWLYSPSRDLFCKVTRDHHAGQDDQFTFDGQAPSTALTRAMGACEFDQGQRKFRPDPQEPEVLQIQLAVDDLLMLATDGLVDCVDAPDPESKLNCLEEHLRGLVADGNSLTELVGTLIRLGEDGLSNDNITLGAIRIQQGGSENG